MSPPRAAKQAPTPQGLTHRQVEEAEALQTQMSALHAEIQTLAKKSPNDLLNTFKLELVNSVLRSANTLLGEKYRPFTTFTLFAADQIPSNSDVMVILAQYLGSLETLRVQNIQNNMGVWSWRTIDDGPNVRTSPPLKLAKK